MRGCEAATSDLAAAVIAPAHVEVHTISHKFDERPGPVKQSLGRLASNKIYRDDAGKWAGHSRLALSTLLQAETM